MPEQKDWEEYGIQWAGGGTFPGTFKTAADALQTVSVVEKELEPYGIANLEYTLVKRERKTIITDWEPQLAVLNEKEASNGGS